MSSSPVAIQYRSVKLWNFIEWTYWLGERARQASGILKEKMLDVTYHAKIRGNPNDGDSSSNFMMPTWALFRTADDLTLRGKIMSDRHAVSLRIQSRFASKFLLDLCQWLIQDNVNYQNPRVSDVFELMRDVTIRSWSGFFFEVSRLSYFETLSGSVDEIQKYSYDLLNSGKQLDEEKNIFPFFVNVKKKIHDPRTNSTLKWTISVIALFLLQMWRHRFRSVSQKSRGVRLWTLMTTTCERLFVDVDFHRTTCKSSVIMRNGDR